MSDTGEKKKREELRFLITPGVFAGLAAIFSVTVGYTVATKTLFGVASSWTIIYSALAVVCVIAGWVLFKKQGRTTTGQVGALFFLLLSVALVNLDVVPDSRIEWIHRAGPAMWFPVALVFGLEWMRRRRVARAARGG
jgi:uncharacterized membrane protein YozB (DUF420 family)